MSREITFVFLKVISRWVIKSLLYVLTALAVSEISTALLVPFLHFVGSSAFIIITLCVFVFGFYFLFFGSVIFPVWYAKSRFIKFVWNSYGSILLIALVIAVTTFLITLLSLTIKIVEFSYPQLLLFLGAGLLIFVFAIGHAADKRFKL